MALRLIEMVLKQKESDEVQKFVNEFKAIEHRLIKLENGEVLMRILLDEEQSETIVDFLEKRYKDLPGNRIVILPVVATLPRPISGEILEMIGREELYENIKDSARCSKSYITMIILSIIVATIGFLQNSVAIIIGSMVIAPMLGPSIGLSFGAAVGDLSMVRRAFITALVGIGLCIVLSAIFGKIIQIDPTMSELATRTHVGLGDVGVGLAAGCAGALAFTTGVASSMVGVMVAVALLPPIVTFGLLLGGGYYTPAIGSLELFSINIISVTLAGITTFLVQGIHPATWWKKERAALARRNALWLWLLILGMLFIMIALLRKQ